MIGNIASYSWNPLLSSSYSTWAKVASDASNIAKTGLPTPSLVSTSTAQTNSAVLGTNQGAGLYDTLALKPSAYSYIYSATNNVMNALGGSPVSASTFFANAQQLTNPLLLQSSSSTASILNQLNNSRLEHVAPSYYLSTFNPYSYVSPSSPSQSSSGTTGSLFNTLA